ncbi:zonadhesin-like [Cydia splendana]|uniref:zonadhesin-like n=1 Tax=Cydia splendana TaxID=1100963 RepID=UPI00300CBDAE
MKYLWDRPDVRNMRWGIVVLLAAALAGALAQSQDSVAELQRPPLIKCKENEVYNPCSIICPPQTCESIYTDYDCRGATKCVPGCDCISEYLRNGTAKDPCIPSHLCPPPRPVCGINEHYETNGIKCELTCKNYHLEPIMGHCQPTSACFCDDGYVRNSNGLCILKKKCPQNLVCPPNEMVSECYNSCLMTCKTRLRSDGRMCHLACIETGCVCKEGYLRHDNGTCVPISQCSPPRCNDNETYSKCGTACPPTCQNRGDNCTVCTKQCVEDCFCNKGLVRADDGSCIKPKDCPPRVCGSNEALDPCPPTCPPTDGCSNIWSKFNCTNAIKCCKPQCRCNPGYLRKNTVCVPIKQCLNNVSECYNSCLMTCKTRLRSDGRMCHLACIETGCVCKEGYLRHDNGTCVPISQCSPPRCNDNETYSKCGTACPPTCQNRGDNCTVCTKQCVEDCFCNKGLVRADDGSCIKPKDCPPRVCGSNEALDPCPPTCPPTDGCSNIWSKFNCTNAIKCCKPQCRCNPGYLRKNTVCVPVKQCLNN